MSFQRAQSIGDDLRRYSDRRLRAGFTIMELMVTIAILLVLVAILTAALNGAKNTAKVSMVGAQISALSSAIEIYHSDFESYPPSDQANGWGFTQPLHSGSAALAEALMGYLPFSSDGAGSDATNTTNSKATDGGYGFRLNANGNGRVYGPYMTTGTSTTALKLFVDSNNDQYFVDSQGRAILYYRSTLVSNPAAASSVTAVFAANGTNAIFNSSDNAIFTTTGLTAAPVPPGPYSGPFPYSSDPTATTSPITNANAVFFQKMGTGVNAPPASPSPAAILGTVPGREGYILISADPLLSGNDAGIERTYAGGVYFRDNSQFYAH
jgi:prepilin-type N-terminal cleavage/methylation domain-containing protein